MERDFKEIDALACEGGIKAIIDEAEWHGENIAEILSQKDGFHEKAFWVFLERPEYWAGASAFYRADSISSSQWNECRTINHAPARVDGESIQALEKALSIIFTARKAGVEIALWNLTGVETWITSLPIPKIMPTPASNGRKTN